MSGEASQRVDKWLWHARIFKTRTLAASFAGSGKIRLNGERIAKPSQTVTVGDVLTASADHGGGGPESTPIDFTGSASGGVRAAGRMAR